MTVELRPFGVACNIACQYCYQNPQREAGNFRQSYHMDLMKQAVAREGGPFTLFGGEPLLLPLDDLEELLRWGMQEYGRSGIQTNGILLSPEHIRLFKKYNVHIGVSIDGPGELNDLRWHVDLDKTRHNTQIAQSNIERLCRERLHPGLIVTLHRVNAVADRLPRLLDWVRQMDKLGIRSMRLHLLEAENEHIRQAYSLNDEENVHALLSFAELQAELQYLRFDVLDEMENSLLGQDQHVSCVWQACDPYTTEAVHGVEGNGQSSNCGRTNKDGIDFVKAEHPGYQRSIALYQTPQDDGGCLGCRFFMMCKGQCPGTARQGDWRNRSELCGVWKSVFRHLEEKLCQQKRMPLSIHPLRPALEQHMLAYWARGRNVPMHVALRDLLAGERSNTDMEHGTVQMPSFVRAAFVGEVQRIQWQPRLEAIRAALARLGILAVSKQILPSALISVAPAEVLACHNFAAAQGLHTRLVSGPPRGRREWMIVGSERACTHWQQAWEAGNGEELDALRGAPPCCQNAHLQLRQSGYSDPVHWHLLNRQPGADDREIPSLEMVEISGPPAINVLLRPLGLNFLNYQPCGPTCEASLRLSESLIALGRQAGMTEEMAWLLEVLDWPVEWTALHGIAEIKTGIIKLAYDTDYTAGKVTIHYRGAHWRRTPRVGSPLPIVNHNISAAHWRF
ncbi:hypothetical protein KDH_08970 [Dictyobacter sp. S3.2.2.5]|uniref:Radical SAM core domain-containing protein n=1 Tax=Dictyobacter halimunensis TaxID=3026934 RepID=A0ABQ6FKE5_9CHLR|nr:hypothetical protein KDH_08970 [Dictyobacter sp. S3.2.2.5]